MKTLTDRPNGFTICDRSFYECQPTFMGLGHWIHVVDLTGLHYWEFIFYNTSLN